MKILKTASGKNKIHISKKEWESMGKKAGWLNPWDEDDWDEDEDIYGEDGDLESGLEGVMERADKKSDENVSRRREIKVEFSDGDYVQTAINGTKQEIIDYYLPNGEGEVQDSYLNRPNAPKRPVKVIFLE